MIYRYADLEFVFGFSLRLYTFLTIKVILFYNYMHFSSVIISKFKSSYQVTSFYRVCMCRKLPVHLFMYMSLGKKNNNVDNFDFSQMNAITSNSIYFSNLGSEKYKL